MMLNSEVNNSNTNIKDANLQVEYSFSQGERGKYSKRFGQGNNLIAIAPDVYKEFFNSEDVNEALRKMSYFKKLYSEKRY